MSKSDKYKSYQEQLDNNTNFGTTSPVLDTDGNPVLNADGKPISTINPEFRVDDVGGKEVQRYSPTPETTTNPKDSQTGSGLEAAIGTSYSWIDNAEDRANLSYKSDVLNAKAEYLTNRQQIESQGQTGQQQIDMQKYTQNQSADKVGWTGGYVLDQERQMNYLKETIKAQMYGQMELQKYGYDTSLAAARLAYDTNRYDLALEYYNTALSRAVSEAEITGYYVSPEAREMLDEYSLASKVLNTDGVSDEDKLRANKVLESVYAWFEDNGISKNGVETMAHRDFINTLRSAAEARLEYSNKNIYGLTGGTFGKVDAQGKLIYSDDDTVVTFDFKDMTPESILEYGVSGSSIAKEQVYAYLDQLITKDVQAYLDSAEAYDITDSDGNVTGSEKSISSKQFEELLKNNSGKVFEELSKQAGNDEAFKKLLQGYDFESPLDSHKLKITLDEKGNLVFKYDGDKDSLTNFEDIMSKWQEGMSGIFGKNSKESISVEEAKASSEDAKNIFENEAFEFKVQDSKIHGDKIDDDFDVDIGDKNYDLDVDWEYGSGWSRFWTSNNFGKDHEINGFKGEDAWNHAQSYLNKKYGKPSNNTFVIYGDCLWIYSTKAGKWGYVQKNVGGNKLYADLKAAMKGTTPGRWD